MRVIRILARALLLVALIGAAIAVAVAYEQDRILAFMLAKVKADTGLQVEASGGRLALRTHLLVALQNPKLLAEGREIAEATQLRALISYHALIFDGGMPLFVLAMDRPELKVEPGVSVAALAPPRLDASTPKALAGFLSAVSSVARRIEVTEGKLTDAAGSTLIRDLYLTASSRKPLRPSPWSVRFDFTGSRGPIAGARFAGDLRFDRDSKPAPAVVAQGRLWGWNFRLDGLNVRGIAASGQMEGEMTAALHDDGHVIGTLSVSAKDLAISSKRATALGDYSVHSEFSASADRIELSNVVLRHTNGVLLAGQAGVDEPYGVNPRIGFRLGGLEVDVAPVKRFIKSQSLGLPAWLDSALDRLDSGHIRLDDVGFEATADEVKSMDLPLLRKFSLDARIEGANGTLPVETKLPPLRDVAAQVRYAHGLLTISQGRLRAGHSALSDFRIRADFSRDFGSAPYEVKLAGNADLSDFYDRTVEFAESLGQEPKRWVESTSGSVSFELSAKGRLAGLSWAIPGDYSLSVAPSAVEVTLKNPPRSVTIASGSIELAPSGQMVLKQVQLALKPGSLILDGEVEFGGSFGLHDLVVEVTQTPAEMWLPLAVDPSQLRASGDLDGKLVVNTVPEHPSSLSVTGVLAMGRGEIQLGFLRAPMSVNSATVKFGGNDAVLSMPGSRLEGQSVDLTLSVKDFQKPVMRIDAVAQRLDLEAVRMVRLPWSPKAPTSFLGGAKATGHIEVRKGNLSKLQLSDLKTDFERDGGNWRVYNLRAASLGGKISLDISGRARDDWIRMKGRIAGMDGAALFLLSGETRKAPLTGKLYGNFDLWANTNVDFFNTLAGKTSIALKDGKLERFTLLTRLLGLIDLKNWLTAKMPNPLATGLPFRFVTADFAGSDGSFYTRNLLLDGPIMDITAQGRIAVYDDSLAMEVGLLPFQTVNWLVNKIPLIGTNLSQGSANIFAAYFRVEGAIADPRITPEPVFSAAEIVKKTLGLPINLIAPNSVR